MIFTPELCEEIIYFDSILLRRFYLLWWGKQYKLKHITLDWAPFTNVNINPSIDYIHYKVCYEIT